MDPKIIKELLEYVPNQFMGADTNFIQMFLCKIEPAFWSMQLLEHTYKPHYHYQNFSPLANGTDLNREKYAILQTHWH